ncbi:MAG: hypothetical protein EAZ99_10115 [Alphaproteobacteria bacterium]|nr:MAG: hypothetical protein EAZ99_10115 [Alphaproteobacteria bacterium]
MGLSLSRSLVISLGVAIVVMAADRAGLVRERPAQPRPAVAAAPAAVTAAPATVVAAAPAAAPAPQVNAHPEETPDVLPEGHGRDETFYFCTSCHGSAVITRTGATRERWDYLLTWMTEVHGMAPLAGSEREMILAYLSTSFPPRRRGPTNPFLTQSSN